MFGYDKLEFKIDQLFLSYWTHMVNLQELAMPTELKLGWVKKATSFLHDFFNFYMILI